MPHISVRVESVKAERFSFEPVAIMQMNVSMMFSQGKKEGDRYVLSYVVKLDVNPPIASISVKGSCTVTPVNAKEGEELEKLFKEKKVPSNVAGFVYSYVMALVSLLARELGLPTPCVPPSTQRREFRGTEYHV